MQYANCFEPDGIRQPDIWVEVVANLREVYPGGAAVVGVMGALAVDDGGGGFFRWDAAATGDDDLGTVVKPTCFTTEAGRWVRIRAPGEVLAVWFGVNRTGGDATAALQSAHDACQPGENVMLPPGEMGISATLDFTTDGVGLIGVGGHPNFYETTPTSRLLLLNSIAGPMVRQGYQQPDTNRGGRWEHLNIEGNIRGFDCTAGIEFWQMDYGNVSHLRIFNVKGCAMRVKRSSKTDYNDIAIQKCGDAGYYVLDLAGDFANDSAKFINANEFNGIDIENCYGDQSHLYIGFKCGRNNFTNLGFEQAGQAIGTDNLHAFVENHAANQFLNVGMGRLNFPNGNPKIINEEDAGGSTYQAIISTGAAPGGVFRTKSTCVVNDITVDGTTNRSDGYSVSTLANDVQISNISIISGGGVYLNDDPDGIGVPAGDGAGVNVSNVLVRDCTTATALRVAGACRVANVTVSSFNLTAVPAPSVAIGITGAEAQVTGAFVGSVPCVGILLNADRVSVSGGNVSGGDSALPQVEVRGKQNKVLGCTLKSGLAAGIQVISGADYAHIADNIVENPTGDGIALAGIHGSVENNRITGPAGHGIHFTASRGSAVGNNLFSGAQHGIFFDNCAFGTVTGNHIQGGTGTGFSAIYLGAAGGFSEGVIGNNYLDGSNYDFGVGSADNGGQSYHGLLTVTANFASGAGSGIDPLISANGTNVVANNV